jgi:hypothetical protein
LLQDPEFLYRVEVGTVTEVPDVFRLNSWEIATRMSYLLWGTTPDDWLLDEADAGVLEDPDYRTDIARQMLEHPRARERVLRFHELWLGYELMPFGGELAQSMRAETSAVIERIVFEEQRPWEDLFALDETFVDQALAEHYGIAGPAGTEPGWVGYSDARRKGILAHGTFLSNGEKFGDTSLVQRGKLIRTQLLCQHIAPPPPDVNADEPPSSEGGICKPERYAAHREGGCASCHALMDPIGLGLENYDGMGAFRTHEVDDAFTPEDESQCEIAGDGEVVGIGTFNGPGELAEVLLGSGKMHECVTTQLFRFVVGRTDLDSTDRAYVDFVLENVGDRQFEFAELLVAVVADPAFGFRREEEQ